MPTHIGALDQGTTSTRFIIFDRFGSIVARAQKEHEQIYPQPGWVEHDPEEIWRNTQDVIAQAMQTNGLKPKNLPAIGITNQRETTMGGKRKTGKPESPSATQLSGRIRASRRRSLSSLRAAARTATVRRLGYRSPPISAASNCAGFSMRSKTHGSKPSPAICSLATSTLF